MNSKTTPIIIGVAGGSGSGKTTAVKYLQEKLGQDECRILYQDSYYIDQSDKFDRDGGAVNFDHPSALEFSLMEKHLGELRDGKTIDVPIYDFPTHTRSTETKSLSPSEYILVDGILIYSQPGVRKCLDHLIFVDACEETRFQRRLERDVRERGRTPEGVHKQFFSQVKPMHDEFVEPSKEHASFVIENESDFGHLHEELKQKFLPHLN